MTQYEVARGSIKVPFPKTASKTAAPRPQFFRQGDLLPDGALSEEEISSLLADKRIAVVRGSQKGTKIERRTQQRGPWSVDPESLEGKNSEELGMLILGIDPDFDLRKIKTDEDAVKQLTKDWDPAFADDIAKAYDKGNPALTEDGAKRVEGSGHELSAKAKATLSKAKARAKSQGHDTAEDES